MVDPDRQKIWDGMLSHLRVHHPSLCRQWFVDLEPLGVDGGQFFVRAPDEVKRNYLQRQCLATFTDAALTVTGRLMPVRFLGPTELPNSRHVQPPHADEPTVPNEHSDLPADGHTAVVHATANGTSVRQNSDEHRTTEEPARPSPARHPVPSPSVVRALRPSHPRRDDGLVINPDYAFENFVVGPNNRLAHAAAVAVGNDPGRSYNPLFIHGGVGLGKTHLLQAICLRVLENNPNAVLYYISCESFVTQFIDAVQAGEMADFRHRFRDVDVLVIDDIHFLTKRDRTQEEFFHTFNSLYQSSKQIVLSSDAPPEDIPDLEDRLVSRFKWGLVAKVDTPDYETRVAILKTKARMRGIDLSDEVASHVAAGIQSNIRELEGAITKLQIQSQVEGRPIDLDLSKAALGRLGPAAPTQPSIQEIIECVSTYYSIRVTELQSKRRPRSVVLPRQICMYLARRLTRHSLDEIGGYFGGRDHTTVMHAVKTIELKMTDEPAFGPVVKTLEDRLQPSRA